MSRKLLSKAHFRTLHIALVFSFVFFSTTVKSQSILIPGDAVFVSVNSEANSFEISPLVALKKGTKLYFSTGVWNSSTGSIESETELEVHIDSLFSAGSIIYIGDDISSGITINGELKLSLAENNLYLYQKEDNLLRFISNINWGTKVASISNSIGELDLPEVLTTPQKNY